MFKYGFLLTVVFVHFFQMNAIMQKRDQGYPVCLGDLDNVVVEKECMIARLFVLYNLVQETRKEKQVEVVRFIGDALYGNDWQTYMKAAPFALRSELIKIRPAVVLCIEQNIKDLAQQAARQDVVDFIDTRK
jgi:hypothetical protein